LIFLEKSDEHEFLFGLKACADPELLIRVAGVNWNFFIMSPLLLVIRLLAGSWLDTEATFVPFLDEGSQGVLMVSGFDAGDLCHFCCLLLSCLLTKSLGMCQCCILTR
jgi:hypothetical protein